MNLPIDIVPGTNPPRFKWCQVVDTPIGPRKVEHEGLLPPSVEAAVAGLVGLIKELLRDNVVLQGLNASLMERVATQSDLLSKKTEAPQASKARR